MIKHPLLLPNMSPVNIASGNGFAMCRTLPKSKKTPKSPDAGAHQNGDAAVFSSKTSQQLKTIEWLAQ